MSPIDAYLEELGVSAADLEARGLRRLAEAPELAIAETADDGREHLLTPDAAVAWRKLRRAAEGDGQSIHIVSAFRSVRRQADIVRAKLRAGQSIDEILTVSAFPGYSEHHTGRAVDVSTAGCRPLDVEFEQTQAFLWLTRNAGRYGFSLSYPKGNPKGYAYEPWHWCFGDEY